MLISECTFSNDVVIMTDKEYNLVNNLQIWNESAKLWTDNEQNTKVLVADKE